MIPKIYLIDRRLTPEQKELVQAALAIHPLDAIIYTDRRDEGMAAEYSEKKFELHRPIAILAEFDSPLTAVNEDGSLCQVPLPSSK